VATIWSRTASNKTSRVPDYYLHEASDWLVLPYEVSGLALQEVYEHKPFLRDIIEDVRNNLADGLMDPASHPS
jgi:hypothetical protein